METSTGDGEKPAASTESESSSRPEEQQQNKVDSTASETPEPSEGASAVSVKTMDGESNGKSPGTLQDSERGEKKRRLDPQEDGERKKKSAFSAESSRQTSFTTDSNMQNNEVESTRHHVSKQRSTETSSRAAAKTQCLEPTMLHYQMPANHRVRTARPLRPILLDTVTATGVEHELPSSLQHLGPNVKVDIFNRKKGEILSGKDAIRVRDLPRALLLHAEYEPIIPPPPGSGSNSTREGRSAPNVCVSESVAPQIKLQVSHYKGRSAVVMTGPYRGFVGRIEECTSGGWYVLENVRAAEELGYPLVVGPDDIEILTESCEERLMKESTVKKARKEVGEEQKVATRGTKDDDIQDVLTTYQSAVATQMDESVAPLRDQMNKLSEQEKTLNDELALSKSKGEDLQSLQARISSISESKASLEKELAEQLHIASEARIHILTGFAKNTPPETKGKEQTGPKDNGKSAKRPATKVDAKRAKAGTGTAKVDSTSPKQTATVTNADKSVPDAAS